MEKGDIEKLLGYPDAVTTSEVGNEEWYYYNDNTHFWQKTPFLGKYLGSREVETLRITLRDGKVLKWVFYVEQL